MNLDILRLFLQRISFWLVTVFQLFFIASFLHFCKGVSHLQSIRGDEKVIVNKCT
jgi:hypothetical protein